MNIFRLIVNIFDKQFFSCIFTKGVTYSCFIRTVWVWFDQMYLKYINKKYTKQLNN